MRRHLKNSSEAGRPFFSSKVTGELIFASQIVVRSPSVSQLCSVLDKDASIAQQVCFFMCHRKKHGNSQFFGGGPGGMLACNRVNNKHDILL